jgi:hypothetical protein
MTFRFDRQFRGSTAGGVFFASILPLVFAATARAQAAPLAVRPLPPVRVSQNGRYFVTADGVSPPKPFFWLADTAWCIFNHPTPADVDMYLDDRQSKGFTVIQGCVAVWDFRNRRNPDGQLPFTGDNPTTINEAYFKNVDSIIDKAAARGMYMAILPFWTKNTRGGPFGEPAGMRTYCKFLAQRYAGRNVFFVLGGDTSGADIQPVIDAEAAGLQEGAKAAGVDKIMITYHPTGRQSSSFWFQERPWLDFNSIQSGHFINTTNFRLVGDDYAKKPVKPTLDMEPGYENITNNLVRTNVTADTPRIQAGDIRRSAYLAVFAGAAGHSYGNGEVYEFYHPGPNGVPPGNAGWHANMDWQDALKLPASGQVQYLRYLIESRPALDRMPDQSLIVGDVSTRALDRVEALRGADGSYAFVYIPAKHGDVTLNLSRLSADTLNASWYDPRTGKSQPIAPVARSDAKIFSPPAISPPIADNDWVLVLDDPSRNYPPPGKH